MEWILLLANNRNWFLTDFPRGCKTIECKWIFRKKFKNRWNYRKIKTRLVVKGFKQKEGIDFFDTYLLVTRIRTAIAIGSLYKLEVHQMGIKTTFLNGEINEEIYMN